MMREVEAFAAAGGPVLGICNGFQVLCEAGLLPGVLRPNHHGRFVCRDVDLVVQRAGSPWLAGLEPGDVLRVPVKHHDGAWYAPPDEQERVEAAGQVALRYADNPNGALADIACVTNAAGNVCGLMPHPEHAVDAALGPVGGRPLLEGLLALARAQQAGERRRQRSRRRLRGRDEVEGVLDQLLDHRRREAAVERHRDPVALVHVVARGDRGVLGAQQLAVLGIALERELRRRALEPDDREDLAGDLVDGGLLRRTGTRAPRRPGARRRRAPPCARRSPADPRRGRRARCPAASSSRGRPSASARDERQSVAQVRTMASVAGSTSTETGASVAGSTSSCSASSSSRGVTTRPGRLSARPSPSVVAVDLEQARKAARRSCRRRSRPPAGRG